MDEPTFDHIVDTKYDFISKVKFDDDDEDDDDDDDEDDYDDFDYKDYYNETEMVI